MYFPWWLRTEKIIWWKWTFAAQFDFQLQFLVALKCYFAYSNIQNIKSKKEQQHKNNFFKCLKLNNIFVNNELDEQSDNKLFGKYLHNELVEGSLAICSRFLLFSFIQH